LLYAEIAYVDGRKNQLSHNDLLLVHAFTEVSALALANIQLRASLLHQSIRDPLTSLYNRRYLQEFLSKQIYQSERTKNSLALLMIDVDYFKKVNDIYGHDAGDIVLKELAQLFLNHVRPGDIACRYGGEEFVLVLYNINGDNARKRAEKLKHDASLLIVEYGAQPIGSISISIGIAIYSEDGVTCEKLIESADKALYFAKNTGRNKVVMSSDINTTSVR
jgi:diguanylate cyclase (GGDEF)-like protein